MWLTQFSAYPKTANYWKNRQKWVPIETTMQYIFTYKTQNMILKSKPAHSRKNLYFIFIGSEDTAQTKLRMPITLWPMTLRHLTRRKKCDDFWYPSTESFPTIYNMNDFAATTFSRCDTLMGCWKRVCFDTLSNVLGGL